MRDPDLLNTAQKHWFLIEHFIVRAPGSLQPSRNYRYQNWQKKGLCVSVVLEWNFRIFIIEKFSKQSNVCCCFARMFLVFTKITLIFKCLKAFCLHCNWLTYGTFTAWIYGSGYVWSVWFLWFFASWILLSSSKNNKKNLDSYYLETFINDFLSLKNDVNVPVPYSYLLKLNSRKTWRSMSKIARTGSGSISQRHGSPDPDPYRNVTDPQQCV